MSAFEGLLGVAVGVEQRDNALVFIEYRPRRRHQPRRRRRRTGIADTVDVFGAHAELIALIEFQVAHLAHRLGDVVVELKQTISTEIAIDH